MKNIMNLNQDMQMDTSRNYHTQFSSNTNGDTYTIRHQHHSETRHQEDMSAAQPNRAKYHQSHSHYEYTAAADELYGDTYAYADDIERHYASTRHTSSQRNEYPWAAQRSYDETMHHYRSNSNGKRHRSRHNRYNRNRIQQQQQQQHQQQHQHEHSFSTNFHHHQHPNQHHRHRHGYNADSSYHVPENMYDERYLYDEYYGINQNRNNMRYSMVNGRNLPTTKHERYKTEFCRHLIDTGTCSFGDQCRFAHDINELKEYILPKNYKTKRCRTFAAEGYCKYGNRCIFIHHDAGEGQRYKNRVKSYLATTMNHVDHARSQKYRGSYMKYPEFRPTNAEHSRDSRQKIFNDRLHESQDGRSRMSWENVKEIYSGIDAIPAMEKNATEKQEINQQTTSISINVNIENASLENVIVPDMKEDEINISQEQEQLKEEKSVVENLIKEETTVVEDLTKEETSVVEDLTKEETSVVEDLTKEETTVVEELTKEETSVVEELTQEISTKLRIDPDLPTDMGIIAE